MESNHTLQLKAVLDTSLVKGLLAQLRQMQTNAFGNASSSAGVSINGLNQLGSTISRLNHTILNLQRSIDHLLSSRNRDISRNIIINSNNQAVIGRNLKLAGGYFAHSMSPIIGNTINLQYEQGWLTKQQYEQANASLNIANYAAIGGAMGGPKGAILGGVIGGFKSLIDKYIVNVEENEKALADYNNQVAVTSKFKSIRKEFGNQLQFENAYEAATKSGDISKILEYRKQLQEAADKNKDKLYSFDKAVKQGLTVSDDAIDIQNKYDKQIQQLKQIDNLVENIKKNEEEKNKLLDKSADSQLKILNQQDEAKFNLKWLLDLKDPYTIEAEMQNYLIKTADYRNKYNSVLLDAKSATSSKDKQEALLKAGEFQQLIRFNSSQAEVMKSAALASLQSNLVELAKPSNFQLGSLASTGMAGGNNLEDIAMQMQTNYLNQQTELLKQIKDILNTFNGNTGSTFQ